MAARPTRPAGPPTAIDLPELAPFGAGGLEAARLEAGGEYDRLAFDDVDLAGQSAVGGAFLECRLSRCLLDGLGVARSTWSNCLLQEVRGTSIDAADSTWREVLVVGARVGALSLTGANLTHVRVRGGRIDLLVLAGATIRDVVVEDCVVGELDLGGAGVRDLEIEGAPWTCWTSARRDSAASTCGGLAWAPCGASMACAARCLPRTSCWTWRRSWLTTPVSGSSPGRQRADTVGSHAGR